MANSTDHFNGNGTHVRTHGGKATSRSGSTPPKAHAKRGGAAAATTTATTATATTTATTERRKSAKAPRGVPVERLFTKAGTDPLDTVVYERRSSTITNPDGSIVFKMEGAEVPNALEPARDRHRHLQVLPQGGPHGDKDQGETSVRQVVHRIAHTIRSAAESFGGYFATKTDADTFEAELSFLLVNQYGAFNSPVWFNCGLWHEYGISGSGGNWAWDDEPAGAVDSETRDAPTSARSARRASSRPRATISMCIYELDEERGAPLQVRLGHGLELQRHPRQAGEALRRRHVERPHDVPRGVRSRGRRDQERRHHAPRGEDGLPRHGPPGDRGLHQLEERARRRRRTRSSPAATRATSTARRTTPSAGRTRTTRVRVTDEFMQARSRRAASGRRASARRARSARRSRRRTSGARSPRRRGAAPIPGVQYDTTINRWHTCPNTGAHQRVEPVLRVHVPRRLGVQPRVASTSPSS